MIVAAVTVMRRVQEVKAGRHAAETRSQRGS